jgi:hypothetical protein
MSVFPALIQDGRFLKTCRIASPLGFSLVIERLKGARDLRNTPHVGKGNHAWNLQNIPKNPEKSTSTRWIISKSTQKLHAGTSALKVGVTGEAFAE